MPIQTRTWVILDCTMQPKNAADDGEIYGPVVNVDTDARIRKFVEIVSATPFGTDPTTWPTIANAKLEEANQTLRFAPNPAKSKYNPKTGTWEDDGRIAFDILDVNADLQPLECHCLPEQMPGTHYLHMKYLVTIAP